MKLNNNEIVQGTIFQESELIHAVSTKKSGNMSYDRDPQGKAEQNLNAFLNQLGINLSKICLYILPVNNTSNVAMIKKSKKQKGRIIVSQKSKLITEFFQFDSHDGFDACICKDPHTFLAILPADCAAVMLYDQKNKYFGLIHAGKTGIEAGIILKTIFCFKTWLQTDPRDLSCYIGPNICPKCYKPQNKSFDLVSEIKKQLIGSKVPQEKIETSTFCTHHHKELFYSNWGAKASKKEGRQIAIIGKK